MAHFPRTRLVLLAVAASALLFIGWTHRAHSELACIAPPLPPAAPAPALTHAQEVWKGALEWCETQGKVGAINPKDRDGTPSYYAFQFKPETFALYAKLYGITGTLDDYDAQSAIVSQMILHADSIDWEQQFPVCVHKLGRPPRY